MTDFTTRKSQALFFYLIMNQGVHSRTVLADLLWRDATEQQARHNLRTALSNLRKVVGPYLNITRHTVEFNRHSDYQLDVEEFQARLSPPMDRVAPPVLQSALDVYRGDFLEGFYIRGAPNFEEWMLLQRERLRELAIQGLHWLLQHYIQAGDYEKGLTYSQRLLALEPWREIAHRQRMLLLARTGQRGAALIQYETCCRLLAKEFGTAPLPETTQLYQQIKAGLEAPVSQPWQSTNATASPPAADHSSLAIPSAPQIECSEMPTGLYFYGRQQELHQLQKWIVHEEVRLVGIVGIGGQGKTSLAAAFVHTLRPDPECAPVGQGSVDALPASAFDTILWRSLLNAPPLEQVISGCLRVLSHQQLNELPTTQSELIALLLTYLRQQRCLLVLDNLESIMQGGDRAGRYRPGYEGYGQLLSQVAQGAHRSCLLLTSRETPQEFSHLRMSTSDTKLLQLAGLSRQDSLTILREQGICESGPTLMRLVEQYDGNPLAIMLVAETINELFLGNVTSFLQEKTLVFDDIRDVLDQQFERLSPLEREILVWLAIVRAPASFETLRRNLVPSPRRRAYLEAYRSLLRRSFLVQHKEGVGLQNVVTEYITEHLVERMSTELIHQLTGDKRDLGGAAMAANDETWMTNISPCIHRFALMQAQAAEHVRAAQQRLILQPVCARLATHMHQDELATRTELWLRQLRAEPPAATGYAAANLLHALLHLDIDLDGFDFSGLSLRQVDLRNALLLNTNFAQAHFAQSLFTIPFGTVRTVGFSPDGKRLAICGGAGTLFLMRIADQSVQWLGYQKQDLVADLSFSPRGDSFATVSDGFIRIWEVPTGQLRHEIPHPGKPSAVAYSPDGRRLATGGNDRRLYLWHVDVQIAQDTLGSHPHEVCAVAYSPDGHSVVSTGMDGTVRLWHVDTGTLIHDLEGHTDMVDGIAFSPDGRTIASASEDHTVRVWNADSGACLHVLRGHRGPVRGVAFSPDGGILATSGIDQMIRLWELPTGTLQRTLPQQTFLITSLAFSPDGRMLASGDNDLNVHLWDRESGRLQHRISGHSDRSFRLAFNPTGGQLIAGDANGNIRVWHAPTWEAGRLMRRHRGEVWDVAFSPDGQRVVSGSSDCTVGLWDLKMGRQIHSLRGHTTYVRSVAYSPDGRLIASGSGDGVVRLWHADTGAPIQAIQGHQSNIPSLVFTPDSQTLISGSEDGTIRCWDVQSGECVWMLPDAGKHLMEIDIAPDGRLLCSCSFLHNYACLWDIQTGALLHRLCGHELSLWTIAFSPDGQLIASGGHDCTVHLWDVQSRTLRAVLSGYHQAPVTDVAFSPCGRWLASCGMDATMGLWDVQRGMWVQRLRADGPYGGMDITGATGLTDAQRVALKTLGAVER